MMSTNSQPFFTQSNQTSLQTVKVQVPGKLYLAGEYAVLNPGHPAILMAVDRYLECQVTPSLTQNSLHVATSLADLKPLTIEFSADGQYDFNAIEVETYGKWQFALAAIQIVSKLLSEMNVPMRAFNLQLQSQLVAHDGQKYGLGSSGAVTVACLQALLEYHGLSCQSGRVLFQLAAMATELTDSKSSLGDVAANCLGGLVYYQSLDRQWLHQAMQETDWTVTDLLGQEWPDLELVNIPMLTDGHLIVGWSQTPASSDGLVTHLNQAIVEDPDYYQDFLKEAQSCVDAMKVAFLANDLACVQTEFTQYRYLLVDLSQHYGHLIETPALTFLIEEALKHGWAAKSSGAGGGDCGIALGHKASDYPALCQAWLAHDIQPLNLDFAPQRFAL